MTAEGSPLAQHPFGVRFEWGLAGAAALSDPAAVVVIVDVLSFTTAVTIAAGRGTAVYPHPWPAPDMDAFALTHDAKCAVDRRQVDAHHPWSLSPAHLLSAPVADRLVLPSPNGSAIAVSAGAHTVIAGSLRNATAVGQWLCEHRWGCPGRPIVIIAAGERWPGGELRPALEDLLGAGAIIAAVSDPDASSPEATAALAAWHAHRGHLTETLESCSSGRELIDAGYQTDVTIASELDAQTTIPVLTDSAFRSVQTS